MKMYNGKKILAIIPARSGSKGIVNKNIKDINGKPLLAYSIEAALQSKIFDCIIVSTDSEIYAQISRNFGAEVPFLRPESLSGDTISNMDVIKHTILQLKESGRCFDYFVVLQPTSPLRDENDILGAVSLLFDKKANSVVSVCKAEHSPLWTNTLDESLSMDCFVSTNNNKRRQDLPTFYRLNGAIYICEVDYFEKYGDYYKENSFAYIMNLKKSVDIDTDLDFMFAELILKSKD